MSIHTGTEETEKEGNLGKVSHKTRKSICGYSQGIHQEEKRKKYSEKHNS